MKNIKEMKKITMEEIGEIVKNLKEEGNTIEEIVSEYGYDLISKLNDDEKFEIFENWLEMYEGLGEEYQAKADEFRTLYNYGYIRNDDTLENIVEFWAFRNFGLRSIEQILTDDEYTLIEILEGLGE